MRGPSPFKSFFQGGFECSTHRRKDLRRLDVIGATRHDVMAVSDYAMLKTVGMKTVRDGLRWHLIEQRPGHYDWSSLLPMLQAADTFGTQVIWDLFHYGWPDHLDIWSPAFVDAYAAFAGAAAAFIRNTSAMKPILVPVNEISFMAWAGGQFNVFNPFGERRGDELKAQLVRAAIAGTEAIWDVDPHIRIAHVEPAIHVLPDLGDASSANTASAYNDAQFHAWDMLAGYLRPELGGSPRYLDMIGINYYCHNQWRVNNGPIEVTDAAALPFSVMLEQNYKRYNRPIFIAETGIEADQRPAWFRHVCAEVKIAITKGVPVHGICLYPVLNHPGWDDDRHCPNGLLDYSVSTFERKFEMPLLAELQRQQENFSSLFDYEPAKRLADGK
jgi:polysaccharide biosynthesis protein PelF